MEERKGKERAQERAHHFQRLFEARDLVRVLLINADIQMYEC